MQDPNLGLSQIGGIQIPQNYALTGNSNLGNIGMTAPSVGIGANPTTGTGLQGPTTGFWGQPNWESKPHGRRQWSGL